MAGVQGIMQTNLEQHDAFEGPLEEFRRYVDSCRTRKDVFDRKVVRLIDAFAEPLREHLVAEIDTLLELEKYGEEKMAGLLPAMANDGKKIMQAVGLVDGLPLVMISIDREFENGVWANKFPPAEAQIMVSLVRNVTFWAHRDWWKFGVCDRSGKL
ncbi:hypothetical protein S40285_02681 [Stachybotrys chlorohalonatus IBT 40285]|uniref:Hemerythrin-like domain-containing protein n=1 Tax=Stachybotrys chlorohalonatus (strain IBT 40285) TaxID=1283841 RepID=A0A084QMV8_STAC4|nr:hypothetical protein S40285_02681 [Stachybotrys chlorohalonata IBT 40285]